MGPLATCRLSRDEWWSVRWLALLVCLVVSNINGTVGQKEEGDACVSAGGQHGTCRIFQSCPSSSSPPSREDVCGFRDRVPIVCCQDQPRSGGRNSAARQTQTRATRQDAGPWWVGNGQPFTTTGTPGNVGINWGWRPDPQDADDYEDDITPSTRRPTTRRPTTRRPNTQRPTTQRPRPTTTRPKPQTWQMPGSGGSISEAKCTEYSRPVRPIVMALPLLPDADTIKVPVDKCKFNRLELIVGGTNTSVGEYPHMAALGYQTGGGEDGIDFLCGGSLISEFFVLTAAHCTFSKQGKLAVVRLGELNLKSSFDGATPVDYPVGEIIRHPEYKYPAHYNDIALLRLSRQVEFNPNIRPGCLYTQSNFKVGKAVATGWGRVGFTDDPSDVLLKVSIDIVSNPVCNRLYSGLAASSTKLQDGIVPSMLCAGEAKGGKDTCLGDSGGPLQISDEKNQCIHYVIGVTSFGQFCAQKNSAGVYSRVSAYVPWIESEVWPTG